MSLALDIGILAVLAIFVILGIRRGAVKTLINVLGTLAAITVSIWLGQIAAQWIYETFFKQNLIHNMSEQIMQSGGSNVQAGVSSALNALPDFVRGLLPGFGVDVTGITPAVQNTADSLAKAVEAVIAPVVTALLSFVVMLVLIIVLSIIVKFVSAAVGSVFKLPVLNGVNSFFGGILGLVEGFAIVVLIVFLIKLFVPTLSNESGFLNADVIEGTFLFKYFYSFIPLAGFLPGH